MPRLAIAATALLALAASAAAAPSSKKVLVCGARQQGVGGEMAKLLNTTAGVQRAVSVKRGRAGGVGAGGANSACGGTERRLAGVTPPASIAHTLVWWAACIDGV